MNFLTSTILSGAVYDILKSGAKVTVQHIEQRLCDWVLSEKNIKRIQEIVNEVPSIYIKSEGMLKEYFNINSELQNILKTAKCKNFNLNQNISGNVSSVIITGQNSAPINLYSNRIKPRETFNQNLEIAERYSDFSPVQIVSSFLKNRENCKVKISGNSSLYIREVVHIPSVVKEMPGCQFTMVLFAFTPTENWSAYCAENYYLNFELELSKNIHCVQLQIKNSKQQQFLDYTIQSGIFKSRLSEISCIDTWEDVCEICFVIFAEDKYIEGEEGFIEIRNLKLCK